MLLRSWVCFTFVLSCRKDKCIFFVNLCVENKLNVVGLTRSRCQNVILTAQFQVQLVWSRRCCTRPNQTPQTLLRHGSYTWKLNLDFYYLFFLIRFFFTKWNNKHSSEFTLFVFLNQSCALHKKWWNMNFTQEPHKQLWALSHWYSSNYISSN